MTKLTTSFFTKSSVVLAFLLAVNTSSFAGTSEVYNSEANLSNLSLKQVTEQPWVWLLLAGVAVIAISAFFAAQDVKSKDSAAH